MRRKPTEGAFRDEGGSQGRGHSGPLSPSVPVPPRWFWAQPRSDVPSPPRARLLRCRGCSALLRGQPRSQDLHRLPLAAGSAHQAILPQSLGGQSWGQSPGSTCWLPPWESPFSTDLAWSLDPPARGGPGQGRREGLSQGASGRGRSILCQRHCRPASPGRKVCGPSLCRDSAHWGGLPTGFRRPWVRMTRSLTVDAPLSRSLSPSDSADLRVIAFPCFS